MIDKKKKAFVVATLRRGSYRWPGRWKAEKAAKRGRNQYECAICKGIFPKKERQLDHVLPVVDPEKGFTTFDDFIDRLYCDESGYQTLCISCHETKTGKENKVRRKSSNERRKKNAKKKKVKTNETVPQ